MMMIHEDGRTATIDLGSPKPLTWINPMHPMLGYMCQPSFGRTVPG